MDFYERALYNDILASQDPDTGMFVYLMSLQPGGFKTYSTPENSFWCCVGYRHGEPLALRPGHLFARGRLALCESVHRLGIVLAGQRVSWCGRTRNFPIKTRRA